jgi:proteasome lid subunit RPN8/RPN11
MTLHSTVLSRPQGTSTAPQLSIDRADFDTIIRYATAADKREVCGFAFVRKYGPDYFEVIPGSVFITSQLVAPGAAQPDAIGETEVMDREEEFEEAGIYRLLWHSHVGGSAAFSSTDLNAHQVLSASTALDAMFFMVVNNRGQATANMELYRPIRMGTQLLLAVLDEVEAIDLAPYQEEIAKKCHAFPPPHPSPWPPFHHRRSAMMRTTTPVHTEGVSLVHNNKD